MLNNINLGMIREDVILPSDKEARGTLLSIGALSFSVLNSGLQFPCNENDLPHMSESEAKRLSDQHL